MGEFFSAVFNDLCIDLPQYSFLGYAKGMNTYIAIGIMNGCESWLVNLPFIPQFICVAIITGIFAIAVAYTSNKVLFSFINGVLGGQSPFPAQFERKTGDFVKSAQMDLTQNDESKPELVEVVL